MRQGEGAGGGVPQGGDGARTAARSRSGATANRPARFSTSTNVSKERCGLMRSDFTGPVNIGSDEMVTIDQLVDIVADIAGKTIDEAPYSRADGGARPQLRQPADP